MTSLAEQIAALQADRDALFAQCDAQQKHIERQRGAIMEARSERDQLRKAIQRQATLIGRYQSYFSSLHHGIKDLEAAKASAKEVYGGWSSPEPRPPVPKAQRGVQLPAPAPVATIKERLARVMTRDAKATNGVAA